MSENVELTSFSQDGSGRRGDQVPSHEGQNEASSDEYGTPTWLIRRLQNALSPNDSELFDLDAASGAEPLQIAEMRYTKEDDALSQPWALPSIDTIYLNPPYSDPSPFLERLKRAVDPGDPDSASLGVSLTKADTSTNWFHSHLTDAQVLCFLDSRLSFHRDGGSESSGSATFPNAIGVFGEPPEQLLETLSDLGELYTRVEVETALEQQRLDDLIADGGCMAAIPVSTLQPSTATPPPTPTYTSLDFVSPFDEVVMTFETSSLAKRGKDVPERISARVLPDGKELDPSTGTIILDATGRTADGDDVCVRIRNSAEIASHLEVNIAVGMGNWELATPRTVKINHR